MYRIDIDWCPPYELLVSLEAYLSGVERKTLELGPGWIKQVRGSLPSDLLDLMQKTQGKDLGGALDLLVEQCPGARDVETYLGWLADLSLGEMYERLMPNLEGGAVRLPRLLRDAMDQNVRLLTLWNDAYFRHIDPAILDGLEASAAATRSRLGTTLPEDLVEEATGGWRYTPSAPPERLLLIPQYHFRPWNVFARPGPTLIVRYPADVLPAVSGEPAAELLRSVRALSDESRLKILRYLAGTPRSFTEIAGFTGLAKSTVNHHMMALRSSGLVRVHDDGTATTYSLRPNAVEVVGSRLHDYLNGAQPASEGDHE